MFCNLFLLVSALSASTAVMSGHHLLSSFASGQTTCSGIKAFTGGVHVCVWSGFEARPTGFTSFVAAVQQFVTTDQYTA